MCVLRRRLSMLAAAWLCVQVVLLAATPVVLCVGQSVTGSDVACTCAHGDGLPCPMHHPAPKTPSSCSCRSAHDRDVAAIASLLGPVAVVPQAPYIARPPAGPGV